MYLCLCIYLQGNFTLQTHKNKALRLVGQLSIGLPTCCSSVKPATKSGSSLVSWSWKMETRKCLFSGLRHMAAIIIATLSPSLFSGEPPQTQQKSDWFQLIAIRVPGSIRSPSAVLYIHHLSLPLSISVLNIFQKKKNKNQPILFLESATY